MSDNIVTIRLSCAVTGTDGIQYEVNAVVGIEAAASGIYLTTEYRVPSACRGRDGHLPDALQCYMSLADEPLSAHYGLPCGEYRTREIGARKVRYVGEDGAPRAAGEVATAAAEELTVINDMFVSAVAKWQAALQQRAAAATATFERAREWAKARSHATVDD